MAKGIFCTLSDEAYSGLLAILSARIASQSAEGSFSKEEIREINRIARTSGKAAAQAYLASLGKPTRKPTVTSLAIQILEENVKDRVAELERKNLSKAKEPLLNPGETKWGRQLAALKEEPGKTTVRRTRRMASKPPA